jgi:hypothetical protein
MKKKIIMFVALFLSASLVFLYSCKKDEESNDDPNNPPVQDTQAPQINITSPTAEFSWLSQENIVTIKGSSSDDVGVTEVVWVNDQGGSGTASGTESWEAANLTLVNGDNLFTFTSKDASGKSTSATLLVTYNEFYTFVGDVSITPDAFFVNAPTNCTIKVPLVGAQNLIENGVTLLRVDEQGTILEEVCELYDDGNLDHGDDILGDGIFSNIQSFTEFTPTNLLFRVRIVTEENGNSVESYSEIKAVAVVDEISEDEVNAIFQSQVDADAKYQELIQSLPFEEAADQTMEYVNSFSNVLASGISVSGDIWIDYEYGLSGMILTTEEGNEGGSGGKKEGNDRKKKATVPLKYQTRGIPPVNMKSTTEDENIVLDNDVLLYAPNWDEFHDWGTEFLDNVNTLLENSDCPDFNVSYLKNADANLEAITDFDEFGLIVIHTHGGVDKNGKVMFLTGEEVTYNLLDVIDWMLDRIMPITFKGKSKWVAKPDYISAYNGAFPNSIVYNGSCESAFNNTMSNAFLNKGANTYFGFDQTVKSWFDRDMANDLFPKLINDGKSTGEAFVAGQHDNNTPPAYFVMHGNNQTKFASDFVNGEFEEGNLTGWNVSGDGRVISQLSYLMPTYGFYMGVISTGLGYTVETGSIFQNFCAPDDVSTLKVYWNFLSEEFLEYVGSQYQDYFTIKIIDENNVETVLFHKTIDQIHAEYALTLVSPQIVFDVGDVYGTDWQYNEFDISAFAGQSITLVFGCGDAGDSIYDTVILLDEILIE